MRQFVIEPQVKKSVIEVQSFKKVIDGVPHYLRYENCYRWGGFVLCVPETPEELDSWAVHQGFNTFEEWAEDYGFDSDKQDIAEFALPDAENDEIMIYEDHGWDAEMIECWDGGCWTDWSINVYQPGSHDNSWLEEETERLSEIYYDEYEEGLEEEGWLLVDTDYILYNGVTITEVPEGEDAFDHYSG